MVLSSLGFALGPTSAVRSAEAPFFTPPAGHYASFIKYSDGKTFVFFCVHPLDADYPQTLFAVSIFTRRARQIAQTTDNGCAYGSPVTDAGDTFVVFAAHLVGTSGLQLWKASLTQDAPAQSITGPIAAGSTIGTQEISANGQWIEYPITTYQSGNFVERALGVYVVPSDGSSGPRALPIIPNESTWILAGEFTADSQTLLYLSDQSSGHYIWDLYAIAVDGSTPARRVTPAACTQSSACWGPMTRDSRYMYISLSQPGNGATPGIYRVDLKSSMPDWFRVGAAVSTSSIRLTADERFILGAATDGQGHATIVSQPVDGGEPVLLMDTFPPNSQGVGGSVIACNDDCIVMKIDGQSAGSGIALYQAPLDGSTPAQPVFSVPPETEGFYAGQVRDVLHRLDAAPDGTRVIFSVKSDDNSEMDLYALPTDGSAPATRIAHWTGLSGATDAWAPLLGGRYIAVIDEPGYGQTPKKLMRLATTVADGPRTLLSDAANFGIGAYLWTPDHRHILLSGDDGNWYLEDALLSTLQERVFVPLLQR